MLGEHEECKSCLHPGNPHIGDTNQAPMIGEQILLVANHPSTRKLIREVLAADGNTVMTACNPEGALWILEGFLPSLIILELQLSGIGDINLIRQIKADVRTRGIPLLALCDNIAQDQAKKAIDVGCCGIISQPLNTRSLSVSLAGYLAACGRKRR